MRESRRIWRRLALAGVVAGLALACGDEKPMEPGAAAPTEEPAAASPTFDPTAAANLQALYEWNPVAGESRDLAADTATCMSQVTAAGLPGVAEHIRCMRNLGWNTQRPQG